MSATRSPEPVNRWLTIAALVALAYALSLIGAGALGWNVFAQHSVAHWIGRGGSLAVICGVLMHQQSIAIALPARGHPHRGRIRAWNSRLAPWTIAAGLAAIVAGFALGVIGW